MRLKTRLYNAPRHVDVLKSDGVFAEESMFSVRNLLATHRQVRVLHGRLAVVLRRVADRIPTLFWLDARWSGAETARGPAECPLLEEIAAIDVRGTRADCIRIDGARRFLATAPPLLDPVHWPTIRAAFDALRAMWPNHHVTVAHDVVVAVPPKARHVADHFAQKSVGRYWPLYRRAPRRVAGADVGAARARGSMRGVTAIPITSMCPGDRSLSGVAFGVGQALDVAVIGGQFGRELWREGYRGQPPRSSPSAKPALPQLSGHADLATAARQSRTYDRTRNITRALAHNVCLRPPGLQQTLETRRCAE